MKIFFGVWTVCLCCVVFSGCGVHYDPGFRALESRVTANPDRNAVVGMWCNVMNPGAGNVELRTSILITKGGAVYYTKTHYEDHTRKSEYSTPEPKLAGTWKYLENGVWLFSFHTTGGLESKARITIDDRLLVRTENGLDSTNSVFSRLK